MKSIWRYISILLLSLVITGTVRSQTYISPRSLAFSGAYATQARGVEALGWNPANLGYTDNPGFMLSFGVLPLVPFPSMSLANNAITPSLYNTYFHQGGHLDDAKKQALLANFPEAGMEVYPQVSMRLLGMSFGRTALALDAQALGAGVIPRALPDLLFLGNEFEKPISLDNLNIETLTVATFSIAHGFPISVPYFEETYLGIGVKVLGGAGYAHTEQFSGEMTTYQDRIAARGNATAKYSLIGYGYAFDLGAAAKVNEKMTANLALNNLLGAINWSDENTEIFEYAFDIELDSQDLFDNNLDSLMEASVTTDTSYAAPGFTTSYPTYLVAGFQYDVAAPLRVFVNYSMGFSNQLMTTSTPKLALAGEYRLARWFPLRFGINLGGLHNFGWGTGLGLEFNHYRLVFGFSQTGGFFNHANGFSLALGQELVF